MASIVQSVGESVGAGMTGLRELAEAYAQEEPKASDGIELIDVPSGWIHLPSTYLQAGQRNVRSFGLRNTAQEALKVDAGSDIGEQLVFWVEDNDSSSSTSSSSSCPVSLGSTALSLVIPPLTTSTVFLAFMPTRQITPAPTPDGSDSGSSTKSRREAVHRAFSTHGSISIRTADQALTVPFFATVCRSVFTASLIDPTLGLASGPQLSSGQLLIDFGAEPVVGQEYHRDILLVNRSEIELVWTTAVVSARHKDSVWFSLRDLDSENVFGVDQSSQPVPLPALSSRHLRLELRVKEPIIDFDFDFIISNVHGNGNVVTCRAIGSGQGDTDPLKVLSGSTLDFGQICDGIWAKKLVTVRNAGEKALDVKLSATPGCEVVFRLAGLAGEDLDEESGPAPNLSRASTRGRSPSPSSSLRSEREDDSLSGSSRRDLSLPPTRPLSRVTSTSSYRWHTDATESDDDEPEPFFGEQIPQQQDRLVELPLEKPPDQIEDLGLRPGIEYRIFVLYRPARVPGPLRETTFKIFLDSVGRGNPRRTISCTASSCTSFIEMSQKTIDFGEVTIGAIQTASIIITNLSAMSAKVQLAAISKVLSVNRNVIVIPPFESKEEKVDFFPRRINERYEKQVFVRNLLNRPNDQIIEIRSKNVDGKLPRGPAHSVHNLTLHSHLYRILTPSGSNFLDFGGVIVNSPTVRTVQVQNLTLAPLVLSLFASQPEDVELFVKLEDVPQQPSLTRYFTPQEVGSPPNDMKERFMETLRTSAREPKELKERRSREKSAGKEGEVKTAASVAAALKKGGRGRPVQLYGNAVVFKDRKLLADQEYLDLASGPPENRPSAKKALLLDTIELEDRSKLSGQHPKVPNLDFAASAKAIGLHGKDVKPKKKPPVSPRAELPSLSAMVTATASTGTKSPALTGKRAEQKEMFTAADVSKMSVDELLLAMEQLDSRRSAMTHTTLEQEEQFVRRTIALRKELQNLTSTGKLVPASTLIVHPRASKQLILVMTPNGSTRPHISTRSKRADSRIYIRLVDFDRTLLSPANANAPISDLPVRDLMIRSSCVRSVLEVQQSSINFGTCDKAEVKSKTIVIQNKSDSIGMFRLRTSGSIASGDLKLGLGRYGVISAFGRKEVETFSFTPSIPGPYQETIVVENVLDPLQDQTVLVKAAVRKLANFTVEPAYLDFGEVNFAKTASLGFVLTNVSKKERLFSVEAAAAEAFAETSLSRDERDAGLVLSKAEEEEAEGLLQKLKIARRKGKSEKVAKYETRLTELNVPYPTPSETDESSESADDADEGDDPPPLDDKPPLSGNAERRCNPTLAITLQPNQKTKVLVDLLPGLHSRPLSSLVKVYEKKNTDEMVSIAVRATSFISSSASSSASASASAESSTSSSLASNTTSDRLHLALMRHCLRLTLLCPVSPTAFCVGSTLFLPRSSKVFDILAQHFPPFIPTSGSDPETVVIEDAQASDAHALGLILGDGYSRQIPGNTHAEANALANFRAAYAELATQALPSVLPPIDDVLRESSCYATMEPCSIRTSGGPSCALELVRARVKAVYLGVEEPPDFVQCEGVHILEEGGVEVRRVVGLEERCLEAARRGRT